jgi:hypothetical protein
MEMIPDDRLLRHTYSNWYFGVDFTGNITKYANHVDLVEKLGQRVINCIYRLVTHSYDFVQNLKNKSYM